MMRYALIPALITFLAPAWLAAAPPPMPEVDETPRLARPEAGLPITGDPRLVSIMEPLLHVPALEGSETSLMVGRLDGGRALLAMQEDLLVHPASNTKLITTAAALDVLGPHHTYRTTLATKRLKNGEADTLYLVGGGDPRFVSESLWALAQDAKRTGLKTVKGDLIVDGTRYTPTRMAPGFDDKDQDAAYRAAVGAASINFNAVSLNIKPGAVGKKASVSIRPGGGYIELVNKTKTTAKGKERIQVSARAYKGRTKVTVRGRIPTTHSGLIVRRRIDNPTLFIGYALKRMLRDAGIKFKGRVRTGEAPESRKTMARHVSQSVARLIHDVNKLSNNFMAEMVLLEVAKDAEGVGDWKTGQRVVRDFLRRAGVTGRYVYENGSGLFGKTHFSARQMVTLLRHMANRRPAVPEYAASLPIAGVDGTLRKRMRKLPMGAVRAKTGTLKSVICISGYVTFKDGSEGAFSLMTNNPKGSARHVKKAHDAILEALARYTPPERMGPE